MKRACLLILLCFALLTACAKDSASISVSHPEGESASSEVTEPVITVNIGTKKIHQSTCRYVTDAKEDNLRTLSHTTDNVNTLLSMGYTLCGECFP